MSRTSQSIESWQRLGNTFLGIFDRSKNRLASTCDSARPRCSSSLEGSLYIFQSESIEVI
jgi:hypothetical protein